MNLFSDLIQAVQDDLTVDANSSLFTPNIIKRAINRAYIKSSSFFNWPELEDAKKTSSESGQEYYDYPQTWRSDSVARVEMDGDQYGETPDGSPMNWNDYLQWRNDPNNASSTTKKWSTQKRRFFIYPVPTTNGDNNIHVWGQRVPDSLSNDGDVTIFSYSMPEGNEAIVLEAVAILKSKGENENSSQFRSTEAKQILIVAWGKIQKQQGKYEKTQPFFDVPDLFGNSADAVKNKIGQF